MSKKSISVFVLTMMNLATILSIKNWPFAAEYGFSSMFYILLAVLTFFIPSALVSAELATGWPEQGGIFVWVRQALGRKMAFLAVWLLWVENVVWYPTILSFIAGTIAYAIDPTLTNSSTFNFLMVLSIFWGVTLLNLRGIRISGIVSTLGVLLGTLAPGILIVGLGINWYISGHPTQIPIDSESFFPKIDSIYELVFLSGVILSFTGIEMNAVHANDVDKPQRSYPIAILASVLMIVLFTSLGTLAIAMVIPKNEISLTAGSVAAIDHFLSAYGLGKLIPTICVLISFGALAALSTWIIGPSTGLLTAAKSGDLPPMLRTVTKSGTPLGMLLLQGFIVSLLSLVFFVMPSVSSSFWMMTAMTSQLYLMMYLLLFISALVLKFRQPDVHRTFKVPGGKVGMSLVCFLGIVSSIFCFVVGFFPPSQLDMGGVVRYEIIQFSGVFAFFIAPFIILALKKPHWETKE